MLLLIGNADYDTCVLFSVFRVIIRADLEKLLISVVLNCFRILSAMQVYNF
jgi:hypothetical protein